MAIASFAPANTSFLNVGTVSASIAIPSGGTIAMVTNTGPSAAFVTLGTTAVAATFNGGLPILPNNQVALTVGSNTTIAAIGGQNGGLVITSGN